MAGLVIDIFLAFIFKGFLRLIWFIRSSPWNRKLALVVDAVALEPHFGCPSVKVHYKIVSEARSIEGTSEIPFMMGPSAKSYARKFTADSSLIVRMNPKNPLQMVYFDLDQKEK